MLTSCNRYMMHDPDSYCLKRDPELRLRPAVQCDNEQNNIDCSSAVVLELYMKCSKWSSW
jgi:hypothetical protein